MTPLSNEDHGDDGNMKKGEEVDSDCRNPGVIPCTPPEYGGDAFDNTVRRYLLEAEGILPADSSRAGLPDVLPPDL